MTAILHILHPSILHESWPPSRPLGYCAWRGAIQNVRLTIGEHPL